MSDIFIEDRAAVNVVAKARNMDMGQYHNLAERIAGRLSSGGGLYRLDAILEAFAAEGVDVTPEEREGLDRIQPQEVVNFIAGRV